MVGKGNFGLVKLVRQKVTNKLFAMKILSKEQVIERKDVEHTKTERTPPPQSFSMCHASLPHSAQLQPTHGRRCLPGDVLRRIRHPFVVQLHYAFQTGNKLYMVMDYVNGGDLYFHLRKQKRFAEPVVKVWISELVLAYGRHCQPLKSPLLI